MKIGSYVVIALAWSAGFAQADEKELYTDAQIKTAYEKLVENRKDGLLNIVPNGQSKPLAEIFKSLGIDPRRLGQPTISQLNMVDFHKWQLSEGYELSVMVANNDPDNEGKPIQELKGYGVRLHEKKLSRADNENEIPAAKGVQALSKKMGDHTFVHLAWFYDQDVVRELLTKLEDEDIRAVQEAQTGVTSVWVVAGQEADGLRILHSNPKWKKARVKGISGFRAPNVQQSKKKKAEMTPPEKPAD